MILSDQQIRSRNIVHPCEPRTKFRGKSFGLSACGYDVRFDLGSLSEFVAYRTVQTPDGDGIILAPGQSILVGVRERFEMPNNVVGFTKDKSTWARQGLLVNQGVLEPGWRGVLAVLLFNVGSEELSIIDGEPIAQVVFQTTGPVGEVYDGKYQDQQRGSVGPRFDQ